MRKPVVVLLDTLMSAHAGGFSELFFPDLGMANSVWHSGMSVSCTQQGMGMRENVMSQVVPWL